MKTELRMAPLSDLRVQGHQGVQAGRLITGYAATFNSLTTVGSQFREQVAPGAFRASIMEDDVRALIDHNSSLLLGRNRAGTLRMWEDAHGLRFEIDPPDTQAARDLIVSIERGDVSGCSFGFRAIQEEWEDRAKPLPIRTLRQCQLHDVSVVTYPAYPDTEVALRSLQLIREKSLVAQRRHDLRIKELELKSSILKRK